MFGFKVEIYFKGTLDDVYYCKDKQTAIEVAKAYSKYPDPDLKALLVF